MNENQTMYNTTTREQEYIIEQIELVLEMFQKNTRVLMEPMYTIIIILYILLVSSAGIRLFFTIHHKKLSL